MIVPLHKSKGEINEFKNVKHSWKNICGVLMYGSGTMLWKEKEISRIRVVQMENFRGLLGIRRMDRVLNARIMESCGVTKL